jgi:hypothetical protein
MSGVAYADFAPAVSVVISYYRDIGRIAPLSVGITPGNPTWSLLTLVIIDWLMSLARKNASNTGFRASVLICFYNQISKHISYSDHTGRAKIFD